MTKNMLDHVTREYFTLRKYPENSEKCSPALHAALNLYQRLRTIAEDPRQDGMGFWNRYQYPAIGSTPEGYDVKAACGYDITQLCSYTLQHEEPKNCAATHYAIFQKVENWPSYTFTILTSSEDGFYLIEPHFKPLIGVWSADSPNEIFNLVRSAMGFKHWDEDVKLVMYDPLSPSLVGMSTKEILDYFDWRCTPVECWKNEIYQIRLLYK